MTLEIIKEGNEGDDGNWYYLPKEYDEQWDELDEARQLGLIALGKAFNF